MNRLLSRIARLDDWIFNFAMLVVAALALLMMPHLLAAIFP